VSLSPTERKVARTLIRRYSERAIANKADIHYSQARLLTHLGKSPSSEFWTDCSGFVIGAYKWADMFTKFRVHDPGGWNFTGIGNTSTLLSTNKKRRVPFDRQFFIGDMGLYGSWSLTKHVVMCISNGDIDDSIWVSHGQESGPYTVKLEYRSDLLVVVRAEDLA